MIFSNPQIASRPVAVVLAMAFVAAFWLPTISTPAEAAATTVSSRAVLVIAAPVAPALM
jgi:hypothetical protein